VILRPGTGNFTVNDRSLDQYFFDETHRMIVKRPLEASDTANKFDNLVRDEGD
jgi:small subunit ribosomal protein S9